VWIVTNLVPAESAVLVDGTREVVSVDVSVKGVPLDGGKYDVTLETTDEFLRPFEILTTSSGTGELDFSGTLTWMVSVAGKNETVTVALYHTRVSTSGRTTERTLLHSVARTYRVVCNLHEWAITRKLKQLFGRCAQ